MQKKPLFLLALLVWIPFAAAQTDSAFSAPELSLPIIIGLGLIDSLNPCVIGVLILLLTLLLKAGNKKAIIVNGLTYTAGVYVTYLVGGLTLLAVFNAVRDITLISQVLYWIIGVFVILAGLLEAKDFFWYGRWFSLAIPHQFVSLVESKAANASTSLLASFGAGMILTLIELPCTGAPYLAVLTLMSQGGYSYLTALPLLLLYNLVFVFPLLVIIFLAYRGMDLKSVEGLRKEHRGLMRLLIGLALLVIGVWILSAVWNDWIWSVAFIAVVLLIMAFLKYVLHWGENA